MLSLLLWVVGVAAVGIPPAGYTFEQYVSDFGRTYTDGELAMRREVFQERLAAIRRHNADTTKTWTEGVNEFTDKTDPELKAMRGLKLTWEAKPNVYYPAPPQGGLPTSVDWRKEGKVTAVKNQGACGSCWTFGAAETLESQWAMKYKTLPVLSEQQILDCTPNPHHCGGTGGCGGGTAELAYAEIKKRGGLASEASYPYVSGRGKAEQCKLPSAKIPFVANLTGFTNLPSNEYEPIMNAIATLGPLAISVDAAAWSGYNGGVFDGCDQTNPDLDHEVQLVGYGTDGGVDYWLVRNSWGPSWGEAGYIRLKRNSNPPCGTDKHPSDGDGCTGGPSTIKVCGTCGILYDVVYPNV